ncbi:MAG: NUDIX hydrolase [Alphaproteobacteria bacterium]|nr:NUDIX hydrolase [Alphaproteobacteria bacterium]
MTNAADFEEILSAHIRVGPLKPVSYLPISTIERVLEMHVDDYTNLIAQGGASWKVFSESETCIKSGAVFAYSKVDLAVVLDSHIDLLIEHNWPCGCAAFIRMIAAEWLDDQSPLRRVIAAAFGDHPTSVKGVLIHDGRVLLLLNERGEWDLPGGRPDLGEDHRAALEREVREETGLAVEVEAPLDEHLFEVLPGRFVRIVAYACRLTGGSDVTLSDEHLGTNWVPLDELGPAIAGHPLPAGYLGAIRQAIDQPSSPRDRIV